MTSRPPSAPPRSEIRPEELEAYDQVIERGGSQIYEPLLNSPEIGRHMSMLSKNFRSSETRGGMSNKDREWLAMLIFHDFDLTNHGFEEHLKDALMHGIRPEALKAIWEEQEEQLTGDERLLTDYIRQVCSSTVTDETYAAIEERMGKRATIEFTVFVGHMLTMLRTIDALRSATGRKVRKDKAIRMIEDYIEGRRQIPTALEIRLA